MNEKTIKHNIIFILLIGIEGLAFGLIDWDSVISDVLYLQYNNKFLISTIAANIGLAKFLATLICIYLINSKKPNKIFFVCITLCAICSVIVGTLYKLKYIVLFSIFYIIEVLILEIFSGYHYAYVYNSLPEKIATEVHSKRISIFKVTFMIGIAIAGFFTTICLENTILLSSVIVFLIFLLLLVFVKNIKNNPKEQKNDSMNLKEKLNLKNYTKYYKYWVFTRFLGKFALSSLVVLLSMLAIDKNFELSYLKIFKTSSWILSALGFWLSAYLIKNKIIIKGDIIFKTAIALLVLVSLFNPYCIYLIFLINGLLNPFNTMSNFTMIQMDKDNISTAQKELLINLFGYFAGILSSYILVNIDIYIAMCAISIILFISVINEIKLYISKKI